MSRDSLYHSHNLGARIEAPQQAANFVQHSNVHKHELWFDDLQGVLYFLGRGGMVDRAVCSSAVRKAATNLPERHGTEQTSR